jgi:hypothetical protein
MKLCLNLYLISFELVFEHVVDLLWTCVAWSWLCDDSLLSGSLIGCCDVSDACAWTCGWIVTIYCVMLDSIVFNRSEIVTRCFSYFVIIFVKYDFTWLHICFSSVIRSNSGVKSIKPSYYIHDAISEKSVEYRIFY